VWSQLKDPDTRSSFITGFLRETGPERIHLFLRANGVDYICVGERRVYKDRGEVVGFGYPRSFVKRLPTLPFLEKVEGDWPGIELWHVKDESTGDDAPVPAEDAPAARPAE